MNEDTAEDLPPPEPATDLGHRPPLEDLDDAPAENTATGVITEGTEPATEQ